MSSTENYIDGIEDYYAGTDRILYVTPALGRFQKDRWDIQDNESIYYDKVLRRGYAEEKMVAIYAIANSGWFDAKYRRESRANAVDQMFDGLANVKFTMLSDVIDEEALFTFSPYCSDGKEITKVDVPINLLTNWGINPPNISENVAYEPKKNICSQIAGDKYTPVHAGWTYFDKMWPMYWTMGNVANTSADTSVLQRFVAYRINVYDIDNYPEPDVNEVQFLNKDGNAYYRAVLAKSVLDVQDQNALVTWKDCKKAGGTDDDCMAQITYTPDGAAAAKEQGINVNAGDPRFPKPAAGDTETPEPKEQFRQYLADKYARLSPSFRLVQSAGTLKNYEDDAIAQGGENWSRLVIMETTIDQLNSYAADNLGFAVEYASRY